MGTTATETKIAHELLSFIGESPTAYQAIASIRRMLDAEGFTFLPEQDAWDVRPGGCYYTVRNGSSIVAFKVGSELDHYHFQISASHADSPTFKVKAVPELSGPDGYLRLNVEPYGGMIDFTWLDRPLSVAGRVMVEEGQAVRSHLLAVDRDLFLIPGVAIHMNRQVNEGFAFNHQVDLIPLMSAGELSEGAFVQLLADELGVRSDQVLAYDLNLVNRQKGVVWGAREEFVSSPRLDDLQCAFSALHGFLQSRNSHDVSVFACFDNEEVGSGTKQGAKSTFLRDALVRINAALGKDEQDLLRALASSFLVSADNAHAVHPNHPEHADEKNRPHLNKGVVIKEHASQLYCTDAFSRAVFQEICRRAEVPTQTFANRSDKRGGSTLGNLSNQQVSVHGVDIGLPQLAMHSSYETAGVRDTALGIRAIAAFY
ncbi:MAG: M18 family aminopeptidase, partial [Atopobiaceae bacterium]|nr:M18 family aminopeptidase [Atopobiaceae bacterium]